MSPWINPTVSGALGTQVFKGVTYNRFQVTWSVGQPWSGGVPGGRHHIDVKPVARPNPDWFYPLCVAGARAVPPEDIDGVMGCVEFLSAITDPMHDEHDNMLIWIGGAFDPEGFDLNTINRTLRYSRP